MPWTKNAFKNRFIYLVISLFKTWRKEAGGMRNARQEEHTKYKHFTIFTEKCVEKSGVFSDNFFVFYSPPRYSMARLRFYFEKKEEYFGLTMSQKQKNNGPTILKSEVALPCSASPKRVLLCHILQYYVNQLWKLRHRISL